MRNNRGRTAADLRNLHLIKLLMNRQLWLLAICQGLFLTNNVTFIATSMACLSTWPLWAGWLLCRSWLWWWQCLSTGWWP
jgi:hypothetical protein